MSLFNVDFLGLRILFWQFHLFQFKRFTVYFYKRFDIRDQERQQHQQPTHSQVFVSICLLFYFYFLLVSFLFLFFTFFPLPFENNKIIFSFVFSFSFSFLFFLFFIFKNYLILISNNRSAERLSTSALTHTAHKGHSPTTLYTQNYPLSSTNRL